MIKESIDLFEKFSINLKNRQLRKYLKQLKQYPYYLV